MDALLEHYGDQAAASIKLTAEINEALAADGNPMRVFLFVVPPDKDRKTAEPVNFYAATGTVVAKDVKGALKIASDKMGRNVLLMTGGHASKDGANPTAKGAGDSKILKEDLRTLMTASNTSNIKVAFQ